MANPNPTDGTANLKSFADMDEEKRKEIASAGGKASGEARRKKKLIREQLEMLLALPAVGDLTRAQMRAFGIDEEDMDNQMAMVIAMVKEATGGNVKAFVAIRDTIGEMPTIKQDVKVTDSPKLADVLSQLGGAGLDDDA